MNTSSTTRKPLHHRIAHKAKHWFIPHEGNDHKPHALRPKALRVYAYLLITAKVASAIFLFAAFPNTAEFAAYTSSTIIALTNESRTKGKVATLRENRLLNLAAQRKAKDMIARNYFAHTTPDGKRFWTWIDGTGYNYTLAGENLAIDFTTPEAAHSALMASPTHRENIMNKRYKEVGVAVVTGEMDGMKTTVLVEMFGTQVAQKTQVAKVTTVKPKTTTTPTPKPAVTPTPKPQVQAEETPAPTGVLMQQSTDSVTIAPNTSVDVWAEFRNTGAQTWKAGNFSLVTTEPTKHDSTLHHSSWDSTSAVGALAEDVAPNDIARFEWKVQSPAALGPVTEHFILVDAAGTELPKTTVTLGVTSQEPTTVATALPPTQTDVSAPEAASQPELTVAPTASKTNDLTSRIIAFTDRFYLAFLFFLLLALGMNIFIKFRIQHTHVIGQTAAVIAIAATGLLLKFHFLQSIGQIVRVLGQ
jgi:uncharacterized protein YkwD